MACASAPVLPKPRPHAWYDAPRGGNVFRGPGPLPLVSSLVSISGRNCSFLEDKVGKTGLSWDCAPAPGVKLAPVQRGVSLVSGPGASCPGEPRGDHFHSRVLAG
jgi:hypothetical protein